MTKEVFLFTTDGEIKRTFIPNVHTDIICYKISGLPFDLKFKLVENLRLKGCEVFCEIPQGSFEQP